MEKKFKRSVVLILSIILSLGLMVGCSADKSKEALLSYKESWVNKDYEAMYDMLSKESKEYISKEDFIKRYNNIYSAIGANNIKLDLKAGDKNSSNIAFSLAMNTIVGDIKFDDLKAEIVKEDKEYKIKWNEGLIFPDMVAGDKVGVENFYAKRGKITDRNNNILADNGIVKLIGIHPSAFEAKKEESIKIMSEILDINQDTIIKKLEANSNPEHFVEIVKVSADDTDKITSLVAIDGVKIMDENSRVYAKGEAVGNLVGYVGQVTAEDLEKHTGKGYSSHSLIGKAGIEQVYEDKLRGSDGGHIYIKRGEDRISIAKKEAVDGEDIQLSIDLDLQNKLYSEMNRERGTATAVDPKTGEVIAMVSSPSYDSNTLVTYISKTQSETWKKSDKTEFNNRANDVYSPGSTFKLITAAIGLETNTIDPSESMSIDGLNWQNNSNWGNYKVTRVKDKS